MLLEASTDDPRRRGEPQSPRAVIAHHQHPNHAPTLNSQRSIVSHVTGSASGPLEQPGEQRMYQTHIFAPPVTGAPMKKGKPGSTAGISTYSDATPPRGANEPMQCQMDQALSLPLPSQRTLRRLRPHRQPQSHNPRRQLHPLRFLITRHTHPRTLRVSESAGNVGCPDATRMGNASRNGVPDPKGLAQYVTGVVRK